LSFNKDPVGLRKCILSNKGVKQNEKESVEMRKYRGREKAIRKG
jgi:hypothetical protein